MFNFFDPREVIRKYFLEEKINLHNKDALHSFELNQRVENLREYVKFRFSWDGEISFLPTEFHARETLLHSYSPQDLLFLSDLSNLPESKLICASFDLLLYEDLSSISPKVDFFIFSPSRSLDLEGVVIFGWRKKLRPKYLGSNAVQSLDRISFSLKQGHKSLECGTLNFPLLFLLERYFYYLTSNFEEIRKKIGSKVFREDKFLVNFNRV